MKNFRYFFLLILSLFLFSGCSQQNKVPQDSLNSANPTMQIQVLDVGQGDSILIRTPSKNILVDAGTIDGSKNLVTLLENNNVRKIDILIATHPHADHIGGVQSVLKKFPVGHIYDSGQKTPSRLYINMLKKIKEKNIPFSIVKLGDKINLDKDIYLQVLSPALPLLMKEKDSNKYDLNNNSITTRLVYKDFSMLLTGDIEKAAEDRLLQTGQNLKSNILKAPHHGSRTSSSRNFLQAVNPEAVIISLGVNNEYKHPHREVMARYKKMDLKIYETDIHGTITVKTDGKSYQITSEKGGEVK